MKRPVMNALVWGRLESFVNCANQTDCTLWVPCSARMFPRVHYSNERWGNMDMPRTVTYRPPYPPTFPDPSSDSHLPPHFQLRPVMERASSGHTDLGAVSVPWRWLEREEVSRSRIRSTDGSGEGVPVAIWMLTLPVCHLPPLTASVIRLQHRQVSRDDIFIIREWEFAGKHLHLGRT